MAVDSAIRECQDMANLEGWAHTMECRGRADMDIITIGMVVPDHFPGMEEVPDILAVHG